MRPFEIADAGASYVAALSTPERLVLAQVTGDVVELLGVEDDVDEGDLDQDDLDPHDVEEDRADQDGADEQGTDEPRPGTLGVDGQPTDGFAGEALADALGAKTPGSAEGAAEAEPAAALADEPDDRLREILDGIDTGEVVAPADPAVRRLLPDASDDPEVAHEFRRLTDDDLRQRKVDRLLLFADLLLEASPSADEDEQLPIVVRRVDGAEIAGALGDVRQVIGSRLGLRTDADTDALYRSVSATWDDEGSSDRGDGGDDALGHAGEALSGPELFLGSVFLLTGYLQESLTDCLLEHHRRADRPS